MGPNIPGWGGTSCTICLYIDMMYTSGLALVFYPTWAADGRREQSEYPALIPRQPHGTKRPPTPVPCPSLLVV
jgi:hypothetical protein